MAPVLQCPDCGQKHPLGEVPSHGAFPCKGCGRVLKVPEVVGQRAAAGAPAAPAVPGAPAAPGAASPATPSPGGPAPKVIASSSAAVPGAAGPDAGASAPEIPPARPVPIATAVVGANAPLDPMGTRSVAEVDEQALGALGGRSGHRLDRRLGHVPWWMRLLLWFVAVPVAFLVVFLVARAFNLFTSNQLSDLFLANNTGRFWPAVRLLPFVALVTAALVQAGVYLLARMRGRRRSGGAGGPRPGDLSASASVSRPRS